MCVPAEGAVQAHVTVSALHDHLALTVSLDAEPTVNSLTASIQMTEEGLEQMPHSSRRGRTGTSTSSAVY